MSRRYQADSLAVTDVVVVSEAPPAALMGRVTVLSSVSDGWVKFYIGEMTYVYLVG